MNVGPYGNNSSTNMCIEVIDHVVYIITSSSRIEGVVVDSIVSSTTYNIVFVHYNFLLVVSSQYYSPKTSFHTK